MTIASLARTATATAAHALQPRPKPAVGLDPYTAWMMRNLPSGRAWHR